MLEESPPPGQAQGQEGPAPTSICGSLSRSCCCSPGPTATTSTGLTDRRASSRLSILSKWQHSGERERYYRYYIQICTLQSVIECVITYFFPFLIQNRPAMNYDKLSRSLRQYYKKGIMKKTERSQRLVYQFCHPYHLQNASNLSRLQVIAVL